MATTIPTSVTAAPAIGSGPQTKPSNSVESTIATTGTMTELYAAFPAPTLRTNP